MKIYANALETLTKKAEFKKLKVFVIYGPDEASIELSAAKIIGEAKKTSEISVNHLAYKDVKDDIAQISDQLNSVSLFGDTTIVVVDSFGASAPKALMDFISKAAFAGILIIKAEDLKPASNIRKWAETNPNAVSIACYKDDIRQIEQFIRSYMLEHKINFDQDIPGLLAQTLPSNRMIIMSEIEKLSLFANGMKINASMVNSVIADSQEMGLDDLCLAVALSNKKSIMEHLDIAQNTDTNFMLMLRVLQRFFNRIIEVRAKIEAGTSVDAAVASLTPPVFFKQKDNLIRVCKTIDSTKALAMLSDLVKLENDCKRLGIDQYMVMSNSFLKWESK